MSLKDEYFNLKVKMALNATVREKLYKKLAQLMSNGVSLDRALEQIYYLESKQGTKLNTLSRLYRRWRISLENGVNFGQCILPYVPPGEAMLIEAGSESGFLRRAIENVALSVKQQKQVKRTIIASSAYPIVLILMLMAALALAAYQIIPGFSKVLPVAEWEGIAYPVAIVAQFIKEYGLLLLLVVISLGTLITLSLPRWTSKSRLWFEKIPPWNIYRLWQGSSFLLSVASLMAAGVKLDSNSIGRLGRHGSPYLKQRVRAIATEFASGHNLGESLQRSGYNFPDAEIIADLRIYATLKGFENNLISITNEWVEEVEDKVKTSMKIMNILALFLIAFTIGLLILSLFGVIQQIRSTSVM